MPNNYLAFTIGPIYQTMAGARYTRELWASSYLFSYLIKEVIRRMTALVGDEPKKKVRIAGQFIVPAVVGGLDDLFKPTNERQLPTHGVGLFPDRFIFQTEQPKQLGILQTIFGEVLNVLAKGIKDPKTVNSEGDVLAFLQNYLKLYALETTVPDDKNIILTLMPYLDGLELQHSFSTQDKRFLRDLFDRVTQSFLVEDAFGKSHSFETILEVATRNFKDLRQYTAIAGSRTKEKGKPRPVGPVSLTQAINAQPASDVEEDDESEMDESEPITEELALIDHLTKRHRATLTPKPDRIFYPAHKYVAIVQADGDNVGKVISKLEPADYERFSKALGNFAQTAVAEVDKAGGMNIYAGGDDLLFFAPVLYQGRTIFDLLVRLDKLFTNAFKDFSIEGANKPTLSFGLSVTYYKFPLYEAREAATSQLFGVAKHTEGKNTIALRVQKHSGQPFGEAFQIQSRPFRIMRVLLWQSLRKGKTNTAEEKDRTLTSVIHKIRETDFLLKQIGYDPVALQAFFDNSFNEDVHTREAKRFLQTVVDLLKACFVTHTDPQKAIDSAYALLRTHRFLTSTELN